MEFKTPDWVHHAVFYQIFPDRFASSDQVRKPSNLESWLASPTIHGFKGGDLMGVYEKLDYLQDLGITAIYLNPIFQSASNHRYHTHDYFQVDPLLGGNTAFATLLKASHQRGIRVVLDGVFNHASRGFFQFNHILETGEKSPYLDWFKVHRFPLNAYHGKPNYECWWSLAGLPTFNHANPQVQDYIFEIARYWIDQGIDGWRLDVPFEIREPGFWQKFREVVKTANPDAYITGEIPWDATPWLQGDQFDGVMNYLMTYPCWSFFGGDKMSDDLVGHWRGHDEAGFVSTAEAFAKAVTALLTKYPRPAVLAQMNLLDSHDTARFLSITGSKDALRLAALFMFTYPGAPCIYYGDEIGLEGGKDPDCRRAFPWDEKAWDQDLLAYFRACIRIRTGNPALRTGEWRILSAGRGVVSYERRLRENMVIVVLNNTPSTHPLDLVLDSSITEGTTFHEVFTRQSVQAMHGRLTNLAVPPHAGAVLIQQ